MKRPYDLTEAARLQGPKARALGATAGTLLPVGMLAYTLIRSINLGGADGWTVFWIIAVIVWLAVFGSMELLGNRALARAARDNIGSRDLVALFRNGQMISSDGVFTLAYKGWIAIGQDEIVIRVKRRLRVVLSRPSAELVAAHAASIPGSYGVLVLVFRDGSRFESIPVEAGIHNVGLSPARVEAIAADVTRVWVN